MGWFSAAREVELARVAWAVPGTVTMVEFALVVFGAVIGWVANQVLPAAWRKLSRRRPVDLHVETDPGVFLAGGPNWDPFGYLLPFSPDSLPTPPSDMCREWYRWAIDVGGVSAEWARVRLTLSGHLDATGLIDHLEVKVHRRNATREGTYVLCRTGGADAVPRGFLVTLDDDTPTATLLENGGEPAMGPLGISIQKGEIEIIEIQVEVTAADVEWTAVLGMIVNGKRERVEVTDGGKPFRITGTEGLLPYERTAEGWQALSLP
jgi:hypothetical protein